MADGVSAAEAVLNRPPHGTRPMRLALLVVLILLPAAAAHGDEAATPARHSRHVIDFSWTPELPGRGQAVETRAMLRDAGDIDHVLLRVCRVENYACRAPFEMKATDPGVPEPTYVATIPWEPAFYRGVREVGLAVILILKNGTTEESPLEDWPGPVALPEGGGEYYYYGLPAEASSSAAGTWATLVSLAALAFLWRRT